MHAGSPAKAGFSPLRTELGAFLHAMRRPDSKKLYGERRLVDGYPDLENLEHRQVTGRVYADIEGCRATVRYVMRLLPENPNATSALVIGCGARPLIIDAFQEVGVRCVGLEPVSTLANEARAFLGDPQRVIDGSAESLPVEDHSQNVVILESVLEHVDSPEKTLAEVWRVLVPKGVAYICTTNRLAIRNDEFRHRVFQWYPPVLKEAYIHHHLHFDPSLGNFTTRPAVHWFSYAELCRLGRAAGFHRFYSKLDIVSYEDPAIARRPLRRLTLRLCQTSPLFRALALTQSAGGTVFMIKR